MKPKLVLTGRKWPTRDTGIAVLESMWGLPQCVQVVIDRVAYEYRVQYQTPKQGDPMLQYLDAELWERWDKKYQTEPSK